MLLQQFPGAGLGDHETRVDAVGELAIEGEVAHRHAEACIAEADAWRNRAASRQRAPSPLPGLGRLHRRRRLQQAPGQSPALLPCVLPAAQPWCSSARSRSPVNSRLRRSRPCRDRAGQYLRSSPRRRRSVYRQGHARLMHARPPAPVVGTSPLARHGERHQRRPRPWRVLRAAACAYRCRR